MTDNPNRLWGTICQHTWALELGEPGSRGPIQPAAPANKGQVRAGLKICWRFNKGKCTFGDRCEFDHRCAVCGGRSHGRHNCYKRNKGQEHTRDKKDIKREK